MRTFLKMLATSIVALACFSSAPAIADGNSVSFSAADIQIISDGYREHGAGNRGKPGKGKRDGMPPGIARNLQLGKPLPPGIAKQALPEGLQHALPAPPRGFERVVVDARLCWLK